jgi:pyruvate/2-oxoglutarate dehydrogenase complex dihydrolipoamide acyltransferase (E2) component
MTPLRKVIAQRMSESWNAVPRVTQFDEADITALNELRKKRRGLREKRRAPDADLLRLENRGRRLEEASGFQHQPG